MNERDEALEDAAQAIEHPDFAEWQGVLSKTKKGQREYEIRRETIASTKRRMANYIRSMKSGNGNDIRVSLEQVIAESDSPYGVYRISDAWRMADLGWLDIFVTIEATNNSIPAKATHRVEITPRGQRALDEMRTETAKESADAT